jgi:hypothetical protein
LAFDGFRAGQSHTTRSRYLHLKHSSLLDDTVTLADSRTVGHVPTELVNYGYLLLAPPALHHFFSPICPLIPSHLLLWVVARDTSPLLKRAASMSYGVLLAVQSFWIASWSPSWWLKSGSGRRTTPSIPSPMGHVAVESLLVRSCEVSRPETAGTIISISISQERRAVGSVTAELAWATGPPLTQNLASPARRGLKGPSLHLEISLPRPRSCPLCNVLHCSG